MNVRYIPKHQWRFVAIREALRKNRYLAMRFHLPSACIGAISRLPWCHEKYGEISSRYTLTGGGRYPNKSRGFFFKLQRAEGVDSLNKIASNDTACMHTSKVRHLFSGTFGGKVLSTVG